MVSRKDARYIFFLPVNFQVHQIEELDRCVFNVFLDNTLPIDYPEGPVGFLSFT